MPYTTQQLIQILDQEMQASWRGDRLLLSAGERFNDPVLSLALGSEKSVRSTPTANFANKSMTISIANKSPA